MTYVPMSDDMELRTWNWYKWMHNTKKTKVYAQIRVWSGGGGYSFPSYPAYALPWNRPPKPRRKPDGSQVT